MRNSTKILYSTLLTLALSGCNTGPTVYTEPKLNEALPMPTDIKFIRDMDTIGFEWATVRDAEIVGYALYRSLGEGKLIRVATIMNRFTTHYVDHDLIPNTQYNYRIASIDTQGFESTPSYSTVVHTLDRPEAVSYIHIVEHLPRMSKIIFRPHPHTRISHYEIERRTPLEPEWKLLNTLEGRLNAEFIDTELEDGKFYEYRVIAITYDGIKAYPSQSTSGQTKQLPPVIGEVTASNNIAKSIHLTWVKQPNDDKLIYNIYHSDSKDGNFEMIGRVKNKTYFDEKFDKDGFTMYYKVTATDEDRLESPLSKIATQGSTQVKPLTPTILSSQIIEGIPEIKWQSRDKRVDHFKIVRTRVEGLFNKTVKVFNDIKTRTFVDSNNDMEIGIEYRYQIIAIDVDGIESYPSEEASVKNSVEMN
jgi:uncharacterized protein